MVCLGNICRSPLAEGIMRSKLSDDFWIDSAGTINFHVNDSPDKRSIQVAQENKIDISHLKGRQFTEKDFSDFDLIFVMDITNYRDVLRLAKNENDKQKVSLLLEAVFPNQKQEVPDPYYGTIDDFRKVYQLIDLACEQIAQKLQQQNA